MRLLKNDLSYKLIMWFLIIISMLVAVLFCIKKQGFHFDENYSYYSTNITYGLWPTDNQWKDVEEIKSEFMVNSGETLNLGMVKTSQSYDVHPPLYYYVLRVVCFITKNTYSKWQGLFINLVFYFLCMLLLWRIADIAGNENRLINIFTIALFGISPGYLSTVTFIRMYVMLTFFCFLMLYVTMKAFGMETWSWKKCFVPIAIVSCLGFLTHYYFVIFAFFVAAYTCLYLVFHRGTRVKAFIYGGSVCVGLVVAVLYYPACLSHIFSGYRGTEATAAFADMSNTVGRISFFVQILNDFTFSGAFFGLALIILLAYVFYGYKKKGVHVSLKPSQQLLLAVTLGYFLLVCKTGMMPSNPAEALRYESPSYGLIILLVVIAIVKLLENLKMEKLSVIILVAVAVIQVIGLSKDKVFFIYTDSVNNYEWAKEHRDSDIAYIYNPNNQWMIWNDSPELMELKDIFFIPYTDENDISDERLVNSKSIFVYCCRADESLNIIEKMVQADDNLTQYEKVEERLYVDIYELK